MLHKLGREGRVLTDDKSLLERAGALNESNLLLAEHFRDKLADRVRKIQVSLERDFAAERMKG